MKNKTIEQILDSTPTIYNEIAPTFQQTRRKPWPIMELIKSHIAKADSIIDIGCGSGRLSEMTPDYKKYLGLDNSSELISLAKTTYSNRKNIKFQATDIVTNNIPNNHFDLALMIAVIHHIPTKKLRLQILKNISSSLKPNSTIIITSWNLWQSAYRKYLFNYKLKFGKYKILSLNDAFIPWKTKEGSKMRYIHSLTKTELKSLLKNSDFKLEKIFYEYHGQPAGILRGRNLVAIATKR
jgi:2-polyprenyl-3-methyl-5-hydroxy-6-metoxy-1,4-benzoquinol methylase